MFKAACAYHWHLSRCLGWKRKVLLFNTQHFPLLCPCVDHVSSCGRRRKSSIRDVRSRFHGPRNTYHRHCCQSSGADSVTGFISFQSWHGHSAKPKWPLLGVAPSGFTTIWRNVRCAHPGPSTAKEGSDRKEQATLVTRGLCCFSVWPW